MDVIQIPAVAIFMAMLSTFAIAMLVVTLGDAIRH